MSGCATGPAYVNAISDDQISRQDKNAVIFLRVSSLHEALRPSSLSLTALGKGKEGGKTIIVSALQDGGINSSSFLAAIPPGSYAVKSIGRSFGYSRLDWALTEPIGSFTVRAGSFANLGVLVHGLDFMTRTATVAPPPRSWERQFPNLYRKLVDGKSIPQQWDTGRTNPASREQLVEALASKIGGLTDIGNMELAVNGPLGVVRIRGAEGSWRNISLPGVASVLAYSHSNAGDEFAALEYGQFYLRNAGSSDWKAVAAPEGSGKVAYAKFAKNGRLYLLTTEVDGSIKIDSTAPDRGGWRQESILPAVSVVDLIAMFPGNDDKKRNSLSVVAGPDDSVFIKQVGYGSVNEKMQLIRFDFASNTAQTLNVPFKLNSSTRISYSNGVVATCAADFSLGDGVPLYKSLDNGSSWQAMKGDAEKLVGEYKAYSSCSVKFIDDEVGFAVFDEESLMRTNDGGHHWSIVDLPAVPGRKRSSIAIVPGGAPSEVLTLSDGRYEVSRDLGRSWRVER